MQGSSYFCFFLGGLGGTLLFGGEGFRGRDPTDLGGLGFWGVSEPPIRRFGV